MLGVDRRVIGADQQPGFDPEILRPGLGVGDVAAELGDKGGKRLGGAARIVAFGLLLELDIGVGDRIGAERREIRIARRELDRKDASLRRRQYIQLVGECFKHPVFGRKLRRIAHQSEQHQRARRQPHAPGERIELVVPLQFHRLDDPAREIA